MTITPIGTGIASQLMFVPETTWGVCPTASPVWRPLEFKSESLELKKTNVQGQGLHAGGLYDRAARRVITNYDVSGSITVDLPNRNLNHLLQAMTGSPNAAQTSTIFAPTVIASTAAYQSYHSPGNTKGISTTFQKGVPAVDNGVVEPFTYCGCKINDWEISVSTGALVQLTLSLDGRVELGGTTNIDPFLNSAGIPALASWAESGVESTADPLNVFHFREATLLSGGVPTLTGSAGSQVLTLASSPTALGNVTTANVKESHSLDTTRYFLNSNGFKQEQVENGFRQLTGGFDIEWVSSEAMYAAFAADTTLSLQLTFTGGIAGTTGSNHDTVSITIPAIKLDGESPKVGGPGVIIQSCSFTGLDDEATAPYQIQYISSDSSV
jgi:hypothetical protein